MSLSLPSPPAPPTTETKIPSSPSLSESLLPPLSRSLALAFHQSLGKHAARIGSREQQLNRAEEASSQEMQTDMQVRKLEISDKSKGFVELLQQLTVCDAISDEDFQTQFQELSSLGDDHVICVIEDTSRGKIVASGSVFVEKKFIRNCGKVGHIEDMVVDRDSRGIQLAKKVLSFLADHARSVGCYKVILDCSNENKAFYEKFGFKQKEIQMVKYFI